MQQVSLRKRDTLLGHVKMENKRLFHRSIHSSKILQILAGIWCEFAAHFDVDYVNIKKKKKGFIADFNFHSEINGENPQ